MGYTLSKKERVLIGRGSQFIVVAVVPNQLHIIPVIDDSVVNWVVDLEDSLSGLGFFSNVVFFVDPWHDAIVFGLANDGRERCARSIIP